MKVCTKCKVSKPTTAFSKHAGRKDGLRSHCKQCRTEDERSRRAADPEKSRSAFRKWYSENQEFARASALNWKAAHKDRCKELYSLWASMNKGRIKANLHNRRYRKITNGGTLSTGLADKLFKLQRGKCACGCAQPLGDDYHLDHRMPLALGGANEDWNIQLLRKGCNLSKGAKHPVEFMQRRGFLL